MVRLCAPVRSSMPTAQPREDEGARQCLTTLQRTDSKDSDNNDGEEDAEQVLVGHFSSGAATRASLAVGTYGVAPAAASRVKRVGQSSERLLLQPPRRVPSQQDPSLTMESAYGCAGSCA